MNAKEHNLFLPCANCPEAALFAQLDTNGDGDVSLQEFHAAKASRNRGPREKGIRGTCIVASPQ